MSIARNEGAVRQRAAAVRSLAMLLPVLAVAALAATKWPLIDSSAGRLGAANAGWMAVAGIAAGLTWVCSATAQQGAVVETLPPGRLLAAQFAASAANHVLPAGLGGNAVNLRFLVRRGLNPARAVAALAVRASAAVVGRVVLLLVLLAVFPDALRLSRLMPGRPVPPGHPLLLVAGAAAVPALALVLLRYARRLRDRLREFLASVARDVRALHTSKARVAALWGGSLAFPAAHAAVVVAVSRAVHMAVPVSAVALAYLFASTAAGWLPTPAGLGSLDAALALTLVTAGASGVTAASAVLGYRLVTTWLPLIPGVVVLAVLVRRRVL
ncbi:lysylphosphatidylglycerol synthase domain-containing protein [Streptomyces sp. HPF1205]|uniref:lysylphosphatidylglycerol synthase transmembrane domain-containing protein n=1 Tax=Streptomyces sp. HPF1205 TaxID=2873262 RepID=UPI001CED9A7C|nr:lysylphosphatidylglycerol synthase domain-containing protein [Streptomyces sp. HPF1205]